MPPHTYACTCKIPPLLCAGMCWYVLMLDSSWYILPCQDYKSEDNRVLHSKVCLSAGHTPDF